MKKFVFITTLVISLFIIQNFVRSIVGIWQKQSLVEQAKHELVKHKKENETLKQQYAMVQDTSFIEEQARNKLLLTRENEQQVVIPESLINENKPITRATIKSIAPWQAWLQLFF